MDDEEETCLECGGTGIVYVQDAEGDDVIPERCDCPAGLEAEL